MVFTSLSGAMQLDCRLSGVSGVSVDQFPLFAATPKSSRRNEVLIQLK